MRGKRDLLLFLLIAFGASWLAALPVWTRGGPLDASVVIPTGLVMMFTPSLGVLAVWLLCHRGTPFREWARRTGLTLGPRRGTTVRAIALAWFGVPLLTVVAAAVSVALGILELDLGGLSLFRQMLGDQADRIPLDPHTLLVIQLVQAIVAGPLINALPALGEEWGWRGWLLPRLLGDPGPGEGAGPGRIAVGRVWGALLLSGVIWGAWHAPLTLKGYNYPSLGPWAAVVFTGFCVLFGALLGWLRLRSASVWPAVFGHASLNASAGLALILGHADDPPSPALAGITGVAGWAVLAVTLAGFLWYGSRGRPAESGRP